MAGMLENVPDFELQLHSLFHDDSNAAFLTFRCVIISSVFTFLVSKCHPLTLRTWTIMFISETCLEKLSLAGSKGLPDTCGTDRLTEWD
jgi:hypothetical protein